MAAKRRKPGPKRRKTPLTLKERIVFIITSVAVVIGLAIGVLQTGQLPFDLDDLYDWLDMTAAPLPSEELDSSENAIHFIDVGQGDAVLIQSGGEYCLIDTGLRESKEKLFAYLDELGVTELKLLVMSHPHADHIGSMDKVIEKYPVEQILLPDLSKAPLPTSATFARVIDAIEQYHVPAVTAKEGQQFTIGDGTLTVLADGIKTDDLNNISQVLYYEAGELTAVLSGDAEKEAERDALDRGNIPHAAIFKAGHHGSETSNTREFLNAISPDYVVICCGLDNKYGHPHREPMQRFEEAGAQVLRTDLDGSVVIAEHNGVLQSYTSQDYREAA